MKLKAEQQRLYELLAKGARCFVRICETDQALWISDLPRKTDHLDSIRQGIEENGFVCELDQETRLWYLDWTPERWKEVLERFSASLPSLPKDDRYHAAYALCRLWLSHPSDICPETLPAVRRMLKLTLQPESKLLRGIASLHEEAAVSLRNAQPIAHAAGCILAGWLNERNGDI